MRLSAIYTIRFNYKPSFTLLKLLFKKIKFILKEK